MALQCYEPQYLAASFRGVPFVAVEARSEHGRRGAEGEFAFSETTAYADLGRKIRVYRLRGRLQNNGHIAETAALIAACELPQPGVLLHPTRGVIASAACRRLEVEDRVETEQGVTYVDLEFVEANNWPNGLSLVGQVLGLALGGAISTIRDVFRDEYDYSETQLFRKSDVADVVQAQVQTIATEYAAATSTRTAELARNRIVYDLESVAVNEGLVATSTTVDDAISLGMAALAAETTGETKFETFRRIANGAAQTSSLSGVAATSQNAVYALVRNLSALYMYQGADETTDQNAVEIFAQIDAIESLLDQEIEAAKSLGQAALEMTLRDTKRDTIAALYSKAYDAPGLITYSTGGGRHPLVAAWDIYGDATRHRDLEMRNGVRSDGRFAETVQGLSR